MIRALAPILLGALALSSAPPARADFYDYLLRCDTEAACIADPVIGRYYVPADAEEAAHWRGDVAFPNVEVYTLAEDGSRRDFPGWFIWIARPAPDAELGAACRIAVDRDASAAQGRNVIIHIASDFNPAVQATAFISPVPAGSAYLFGQSFR